MSRREVTSVKRCVAVGLLMALTACGVPDYSTVTDVPAPVKASVDRAVSGGHRTGVVLGMLNPVGQTTYAQGVAVAGEGALPVRANSQFALGSLTKLFTAELFANLVLEGIVEPDTRLIDIWPEVQDSADTRLWHLASHRADLPRDIPVEALLTNDVAPLLALLSAPRTLGEVEAYSSAGMALLGQALAQVAGLPLPELLQGKVLRPMGLSDTGFLPGGMVVHPHVGGVDISAQRVATTPVAYGAGGLYSTAGDLLVFLQKHLRPDTAESIALNELLFGNAQQAPWGWKVYQQGDLRVFHHGGDGNGYQGFVGLRPDNGVAVVLLSNSSADDELQQIALHLIDPEIDLPEFDYPPAMAISARELAAFAGHFLIEEEPRGNTIALEVQDSRLIYHELTPQGDTVRRSRLYAIGDSAFHLRDVPVTIVFEPGGASALLSFNDTELTLLRQ